MTIKEISEELGKSKTYINNLLNERGLKDKCSRIGNKIDIPDDIVEEIRAAVNEKSMTPAEKEITFYRDQLQKKDAMIERLQAENIELVRTIQKHTLMLEERLPARSEPIQTESQPAETPSETISTTKKSIFDRILGR